MNPLIFIKFAAVSFQKQITYRFDYFMSILNGFLFVFIFTSLWKSLYNQSAETNYSGFSISAIITYAVLAMVVRISFSMDDTVIKCKVQDGSVAIDLMRPVSFFYMNLAECSGYSFFHFFARAIPILVISSVMFDISIAVEGINFLFFPISALFGYLILFMLNYIIGLLAFWFVEVFPFMLLKYGMFTLLSGGIVPIDFFPETIKPAIALLPFQYILYSPTVILMGHVSSGTSIKIIAAQFIWIIVLGFLCSAMWKSGRKKLMIQGG